MLCFRRIAFSLTYAIILVLPIQADVLKQPNGEPIVLRKDGMPSRGMTKQQVETGFGAPRARQPAVGSPQISSWEYDHYRVYFEENLVLHVVVQHTEETIE